MSVAGAEIGAAANWARRSWPGILCALALAAIAAAQIYIIFQLQELHRLADETRHDTRRVGVDFDTPMARQAAEGAQQYSREALEEARRAREMAALAAASSARVEERLQYR